MKTVKEIEANAKIRMEKVLSDLQHDMAAVRTGRASVSLLDSVRADYYGTPTPLNQLATLHVPEPSVITLNMEVAGRAVTDFLFMVCGLHHRDTSMLHEMYEPRERELTPTRFQADPMCSCCSTCEHSRFALGDGRVLPTRW